MSFLLLVLKGKKLVLQPLSNVIDERAKLKHLSKFYWDGLLSHTTSPSDRSHQNSTLYTVYNYSLFLSLKLAIDGLKFVQFSKDQLNFNLSMTFPTREKSISQSGREKMSGAGKCCHFQ